MPSYTLFWFFPINSILLTGYMVYSLSHVSSISKALCSLFLLSNHFSYWSLVFSCSEPHFPYVIALIPWPLFFLNQLVFWPKNHKALSKSSIFTEIIPTHCIHNFSFRSHHFSWWFHLFSTSLLSDPKIQFFFHFLQYQLFLRVPNAASYFLICSFIFSSDFTFSQLVTLKYKILISYYKNIETYLSDKQHGLLDFFFPVLHFLPTECHFSQLDRFLIQNFYINSLFSSTSIFFYVNAF